MCVLRLLKKGKKKREKLDKNTKAQRKIRGKSEVTSVKRNMDKNMELGGYV